MKFLFNIFLLFFCIVSYADFTFKVDDVEEKENLELLGQASTLISHKFEGEIEAYNVPYERISISEINGFIHTVKLAYDNHLKLEIKPDDIWLLICQGLAIHINENYKAMKPFILKDPTVNAPIQLHVRRDDFVKGKSNPWDEVVAEFARQIDQNTKDELLKLFVPDFSTTTPENKVVFEMTLMKTTDCYFEYVFDTFCGIPEITLTGTPEDWINLKKRIYSLDKFKLFWWTKELHPVIDEFISASKGNPNIAFWKRILKAEEGSGEPLRINGWILKFFPYLASNADKFYKNPYINTEVLKLGLAANIFPKGITHVKFKWNYLTEFFDMEMCSGFIGANVDDKKVTRAAIGWTIKEYTPPPIITGLKGEYAVETLYYCYITVFTLVFIAVCIHIFLAKRGCKQKLYSLIFYVISKFLILGLPILCFYLIYYNSFNDIGVDPFCYFIMGKLSCFYFSNYVQIWEVIFECSISTAILTLILFPYKKLSLNILFSLLGIIIWFTYLFILIDNTLIRI